MQNLKFFSDDIAARYGKKLYRIPIDLALGCPNRRDRYGSGCIFCSEDGSRARHLARHLDLGAQVAGGVAYAGERYGATGPYIAYFQAFTSTYATLDTLRAMYGEVLRQADFKVVIIGTRPDALEPEKIAYLQELAQKYEVWVELGVQSANDDTLNLIKRGHNFAAVTDCVRHLAASGINCACHLILGLPGENAGDWENTARAVSALPFRAVKAHQLLVLRRTELATYFAAKSHAACPVPLNEYDYAAGLKRVLRLLPDEWLIMRLNADAAPEEIIAPNWWMSKGQFIEFFRKEFAADHNSGEFFPGVATADGSVTLYHPEFRQHFHSLAGAVTEAERKFVEPSELEARLRRTDVNLLDIGFGLGINCAAAIRCAERTAAGRLHIDSLELDMRTLEAALTLYQCDSPGYALLNSLRRSGKFRTAYCDVTLHTGDARRTCPTLDGAKYWVIFHDGFSPDSNPELWSCHFVRLLRRLLTPDGVIASYSSAYTYRGALLRAGLQVGESLPFGRKRGGTLSGFVLPSTAQELPVKEYGIILRSTAGLPYSDRTLNSTREEIFSRHKRTLARLRARGIPKWYKVP